MALDSYPLTAGCAPLSGKYNGSAALAMGPHPDPLDAMEAALRLHRRDGGEADALARIGEEGIAAHDGSRVQDCNEAFAQMFGHLSRCGLIGSRLDDLLDLRALRVLRARGRRPDARPFDAVGTRRDGSTFAVELIAKPVIHSGLPTFAIVVRDVSRRKRMEQSLRAEALKQKRLAQRNKLVAREMSHRMMNSFSAVQALLNLQGRQVTDLSARRTVSGIAGRVRAMAFVQKRLFEAEGSGRFGLRTTEYLCGLAQDLERGFFGAGQCVTFEAAGNLRLATTCASALGMIVTELVINAAKHAFPDGRPGRVEVRLERLQGRHRLSVADDGAGLPPNLDLSNTAGSGMFIVRGLTQQLDGAFEVERLQRGTRFLVTFPG